MKYFVSFILNIILVSSLVSTSHAMCAGPLEWWGPCNDTGKFSEGIYVKYSILIPALVTISGIALLVYWKKKK